MHTDPVNKGFALPAVPTHDDKINALAFLPQYLESIQNHIMIFSWLNGTHNKKVRVLPVQDKGQLIVILIFSIQFRTQIEACYLLRRKAARKTYFLLP